MKNLIKYKCKHCGKIFRMYPSGKQKCCSLKCAYRVRKKLIKYKKLKCSKCGKIFKRPASRVNFEKRYFCSYKCAGAFKKDKPNLKLRKREIRSCLICKKGKFEVIISSRKKYCSRKCVDEALSLKNRIITKCLYCGKKIISRKAKIRAGRDKYCSFDHFAKSLEKKKTRLKCKNCGKIFETTPIEGKRRVYCSKKCQDEVRTLRTTRRCVTCGKEFIIRPWQIKRGTNYHCSQECFHKSKYPTIPERIIKEYLRKKKIWYRSQKSISYWIVDFLLPRKVIFEADGDYWHGKKDQQIKDIIKDKDLRRLGYRVYRFREKNLIETQGSCIDNRFKKLYFTNQNYN